MIIVKVKCKKCNREHKVQEVFTTMTGITCNMLAYSEIELEFWCNCGSRIYYNGEGGDDA